MNFRPLWMLSFLLLYSYTSYADFTFSAPAGCTCTAVNNTITCVCPNPPPPPSPPPPPPSPPPPSPPPSPPPPPPPPSPPPPSPPPSPPPPSPPPSPPPPSPPPSPPPPSPPPPSPPPPTSASLIFPPSPVTQIASPPPPMFVLANPYANLNTSSSSSSGPNKKTFTAAVSSVSGVAGTAIVAAGYMSMKVLQLKKPSISSSNNNANVDPNSAATEPEPLSFDPGTPADVASLDPNHVIVNMNDATVIHNSAYADLPPLPPEPSASLHADAHTESGQGGIGGQAPSTDVKTGKNSQLINYLDYLNTLYSEFTK